MRASAPTFVSALLLTATFSGALPAEALPATQEGCARVSLLLPSGASAPTWLSAAMWVPAPVGKVLAVDAGGNRLLLYGDDGAGSVVPQPKGELPALLTTFDDRVLVQLVEGDVVSLDANLEDHQRNPTFTRLSPQVTIHEWASTSTSLLAFGHMAAPQAARGFQPGVFRITPAAGGGRSVADLILPVQSWDYYLLGYDYLATIGDTGYFLDLDKGIARLFEFPAGGGRRQLVNAVPAEIRAVPPIDAKMSGPRDAPALYERLESFTMVAGLYGAPDGKLYLLARAPGKNGATAWWMYRIDPTQGRVEGKARLPTGAPFLSVALSKDTLYLIERSKVNSKALQTISTMVTVPMRQLGQAPQQGTDICPMLEGAR